MNTYIVIPTIRTLDFLKDWGDQFQNCHILIVEDHPTREIAKPKISCLGIHHYTWGDIASDFKSNEWIFSRKNAGIRSYGFWKAYQLGADVIVTLDDDCYPVEEHFILQHIKHLSMKSPDNWFPTFPHRDFVFTRGFPYKIRNKYRVVISHGLWSNQIDLDGITQIKHPNINIPSYPSICQFVPNGLYFPMCSMNLAFRREVTPIMYFPLMGFDPEGNAWGYDRFDDIWAGLFAKKICDHLHISIINGSPFVEHRKASDPRVNIRKEETGIAINEILWKAVDQVVLTQNTPARCYVELAKNIRFPSQPYFVKLQQAMNIWGSLFE